jgi:Tol biopolymer transport system component
MRLWARTLVILLLVAVPAAGQYRAIGGKNKIRYDEFVWHTYDTPHFRISYYDRVAPKLEKIASFAESSYDELARRLNFQILEPVPLIVYASHAEFEQNNIIVGFIPEGVGAFATPVRNRMVMPADLSDQELQALIQHELTHIFQYEILFQGRRGRAIYARPPQWFMEGMASYFADDETSRDEMYMRDAVLSDIVPTVARPPAGFLAYRYGHKVFEFIEEEYGEDGVRDFVFAFRGAGGGNPVQVLKKSFNVDVEQFDAEFRGWMREKYLPYRDRGTPREYGRPFEVQGKAAQGSESSPAVSPSGELVAAFTTYKQDIDVAIFGAPDRRLYKNLTKGYTTKYEYLIAQGFTTAPAEGRDLAFSPDGNRVAVFARTERTRSLLLLNANRGGIAERYNIPLPIDQSANPAFSPDGRTIAFRATRYGQFDIYLLDVETGEVSNLTDDEQYDAAPTFSPDGEWIVYTSLLGEYGKLVGINLEDPSRREQLTFGVGNDEGAAFSSDGESLYFASDRQDGIYDIYKLGVESRKLERLTFVGGGALNPVPVETVGGERVGFQAYHRGRWDLYGANANQGEPVGLEEPPTEDFETEPFVPAVSITVDPEKGKKVKGRKLHIEDANAAVGVDNEGNFLSMTYFTFSDQYGDRRFNLLFDSIDTFSNFRVSYVNLRKRFQWGASIYDSRTFYRTGYDPVRGQFNDREQIYRVTAATVDGVYPLSRYYRLQGNVGYYDRSAEYPVQDPFGGFSFQTFDDRAPVVSGAIVGDTVSWQRYGPHQGARWEFRLSYSPDLDEGGTLTQSVYLDARKYLALSRRNEIALRLFGVFASGNRPVIYGIGGADTVRGFPIRSLAGNQVAFANVEWRFPLFDRIDLAFMSLGQVRGRFFLDVGMSCYSPDEGQEFNYLGQPGCTFIGEKEVIDPITGEPITIGESGRLTDGVSTYGFGFTIYVFGLPMHWDFIKRWDFKETLGSTEVDFWIGTRF